MNKVGAVRPPSGLWQRRWQWLHRNPLPSSSRIKCLVVTTFLTLTLAYTFLYTSGLNQSRRVHLPRPDDQTDWKHPIDDLILIARAQFNRVLGKQSYDLTTAARQYRQKRGKHPPPGFDAWFDYAQSKDAVIVEDFFDRIYKDLSPYWAIDAKTLRYQANAYDFTISVRNGNASYKTDDKPRVPWIELWHGLVQELQELLPDVDIPVNMMDESRLLVPWEDIDEYMAVVKQQKNITPVAEVVTNFTGLGTFDVGEAQGKEEEEEAYDPQWLSESYWDLIRQACPPTSPSRNATALTDFKEPILLPPGYPENSSEGYVANWTFVKDVCMQPHLRGLHGTFIEPISISTSRKLIPLFGGSKLSMNNDILLPPAAYLTRDSFYSARGPHGMDWEHKKNALIWRGDASGGRNKATTWTHFQRHRFVQMMNGTAVRHAETTRIRGETFNLPSWEFYSLRAPRNGYLGDWLSTFTDAAFVDLVCFPRTSGSHCPYTDPFFETRNSMPLTEMYSYKFLPDIDGNSLSGQFNGFLHSSSLPFKATVYNEWHDDRLFPWLHFVPLDNSFVDVYGVLEYFFGYDGHGAREAVGKGIAEEGKEWAGQVLRREDMAIYVYRLLLEWARVCDDQREVLGWIGDL